MKIFVTGGAGFIGTHLVRRLQSEGHTVLVYDKVNGDDLLNYYWLEATVKGYDFVWHLAANADTRRGIKDTAVDFNNGVVATFNLLEAMRLNGIHHLGYTSSATIYGDSANALPVDELVASSPISLYGASKVACEAMINAYTNLFDFHTWIYRLSRTIGPGMEMGVIHDLVVKLRRNPAKLEVLGDGMQEGPFLSVGDCVDALLQPKGEGIYNVGNTDTVLIKELVGVILKEMNLNPKVTYTGGKKGWRGDTPVVHLDISKIRATSWTPGYNSEETIRSVVKELICPT